VQRRVQRTGTARLEGPFSSPLQLHSYSCLTQMLSAHNYLLRETALPMACYRAKDKIYFNTEHSKETTRNETSDLAAPVRTVAFAIGPSRIPVCARFKGDSSCQWRLPRSAPTTSSLTNHTQNGSFNGTASWIHHSPELLSSPVFSSLPAMLRK
jgi:hypothetical protein